MLSGGPTNGMSHMRVDVARHTEGMGERDTGAAVSPDLGFGADGAAHQHTQACLSDDNLSAQHRLFQDLRSAARSANISIDDVAESLGVDAGTAVAALEGAIDLSLSDLQQLCFAVDAYVTYNVTNGYSRKLDELYRFIDDDVWVKSAAPEVWADA